MTNIPFEQFDINGAQVIIYPMKSVRAAELHILVKGGSAYEGPDWGAFHLLEHMFHTGTKMFPNKGEYELFKEEYGISHGASTSPTTVDFKFKFPKNSLNQTMTLANEFLFNPLLKPSEIEKEVSIISQEYIDKWSSPHARFARKTWSFLYGPSHPLARDAMGEPDFIKTLKHKDLATLHQKYLQPQNMIIGLAGNVDKNKAHALLTSMLSDKPNTFKSELNLPPHLSHLEEEKKMWHKEDVDSVIVSHNWFVPGNDDLSLEEYLNLSIVSYLLGSVRGVLFKNLREKMSWVYKCGAHLETSHNIGKMEVWASSSKEKAKMVSEESVNLTYQFLNNPIDPLTFERAKKFINIQRMLSYDSVSSIAAKITSGLYWDKRLILPEEWEKEAAKLTEKSVRAFALRYINEKITPLTAVMSRDNLL